MVVEPARHQFTVDEWQRMGEVGLFAPDKRLELLAGEIVEMTPIGVPHADVVDRLTRWAFGVGDRARVSVQNPLRLDDFSDLQPDLMLLRPSNEYRSRRPRPDDVLLLIEVSDTTARWDRRVKRPRYAAAGVAEIWIVDLGGGLLEVATEPAPTGYAQVAQRLPGELAVPTAFRDLTLRVDDLLG